MHTHLIKKTGKAEITVKQEDTAAFWGSGLLPVLSTPRLVALMECAAVNAVENSLEEGFVTVGIHIDIKHLAATPLSMKAAANARVTGVEGKIITFEIQAFDEKDEIGYAIHKRAVVSKDKFMDKITQKLKK